MEICNDHESESRTYGTRAEKYLYDGDDMPNAYTAFVTTIMEKMNVSRERARSIAGDYFRVYDAYVSGCSRIKSMVIKGGKAPRIRVSVELMNADGSVAFVGHHETTVERVHSNGIFGREILGEQIENELSVAIQEFWSGVLPLPPEFPWDDELYKREQSTEQATFTHTLETGSNLDDWVSTQLREWNANIRNADSDLPFSQ